MSQIFAEGKSECGEFPVTCATACVQIQSHDRVSSYLNLRSSAKSAVSLRIAFTEVGTP
jgi:hypothetical protein